MLGRKRAEQGRYGLYFGYAHQSLFGLGATQVSGPGVVSLVDHHRSHADIISFSNKEFYEDRLRVATRYDDLKSPNRSEPGVRWVDVTHQNHSTAYLPIDERVWPAGSCTGGFRTQAPETLHNLRR